MNETKWRKRDPDLPGIYTKEDLEILDANPHFCIGQITATIESDRKPAAKVQEIGRILKSFEEARELQRLKGKVAP